ncbi:pyridoxamine 5'-phosphate oxidase family protein [Candidatus Entotheonella palauensis]|uniref:pyridoxamine 5'-phosphate oxidase family protein n=1 Tax=Candidatus Entotheonella palauensis TaxID=93172 RepID=UPI0015C4339C|nr:pyridoxamine 5'-phosphate oxidase family protein [Candidatus Entotheonella palauensis]
MPPLKPDELYTFLTTGRHILKLATLTPDGWPYIVPVWYIYDGGAFTILARPKNRWVAYVESDPRVSLCIDTVGAPYARVLIKGLAEIVDPQWIGPWKDLAIRYLGLEAGQTYYKETKMIPRVNIRITPQEITTWGGGGWHPRYNS